MEEKLIKRERRMGFYRRLLEGNALFYVGVTAFCIGLAAGIALCAAQFGGAITDFFGMSCIFNTDESFFDVFLSFFIADIRLMLIFFAFGFTAFGLPAYILVQIFCGFTLGCSALVVFSSLGVYGILPVGAALIPHMLAIITANAFSAKSIIPVSLRILEIFRKDDIIIVQSEINISNCMYSFALSAVFAAVGSLLCAAVAMIK